MRTLILSDIHLGSRNCNSQAVLEVLGRERFDRLILNGDTVNSVNLRKLQPEHWQVLSRLRDIGKNRELILIRGNHDHEDDHPRPGQTPVVTNLEVNAQLGRRWFVPRNLHRRNGRSSFVSGNVALAQPPSVLVAEPCEQLGTYNVLPALLGTPMIEEYLIEAGARQYLVMHGDRFDPTLRYPIVTEMADWCYQISQKVSRKLAKWLKKKSKRWGGLLDYIRTQTVAHARSRDHNGIITGHTHYPEDVHVDGVHYLNSGCWTDTTCSYLVLNEDEAQLCFY